MSRPFYSTSLGDEAIVGVVRANQLVFRDGTTLTTGAGGGSVNLATSTGTGIVKLSSDTTLSSTDTQTTATVAAIKTYVQAVTAGLSSGGGGGTTTDATSAVNIGTSGSFAVGTQLTVGNQAKTLTTIQGLTATIQSTGGGSVNVANNSGFSGSVNVASAPATASVNIGNSSGSVTVTGATVNLNGTVNVNGTALGSIVTATSGPVGYDIIVLAGQSNMLGLNFAGTAAPQAWLDQYDVDILQLGQSSAHLSQVIMANDGVMEHADSTVGASWASTSIGMTFARLYKTYKKPGRKLLLVPCALGGTAMTTTNGSITHALLDGTTIPSITWDPSGTWSGSTYTPGAYNYSNLNLFWLMLKRTYIALASDPTQSSLTVPSFSGSTPPTANVNNKVVALIWHQGETDVGTAQASYLSSITSIITLFRQNFGSTIPFVSGGFCRTGYPNFSSPYNNNTTNCTCFPEGVLYAISDTTGNTALSAIAAPILYTGFAQSTGTVGDTGSVIHFNSPSLRTMGSRYWNAYVAALANTPSGITSITGTVFASVGLYIATNNSYPVSFTFSATNATQYSISGSSTVLTTGLSGSSPYTVILNVVSAASSQTKNFVVTVSNGVSSSTFASCSATIPVWGTSSVTAVTTSNLTAVGCTLTATGVTNFIWNDTVLIQNAGSTIATTTVTAINSGYPLVALPTSSTTTTYANITVVFTNSITSISVTKAVASFITVAGASTPIFNGVTSATTSSSVQTVSWTGISPSITSLALLVEFSTNASTFSTLTSPGTTYTVSGLGTPAYGATLTTITTTSLTANTLTITYAAPHPDIFYRFTLTGSNGAGVGTNAQTSCLIPATISVGLINFSSTTSASIPWSNNANSIASGIYLMVMQTTPTNANVTANILGAAPSLATGITGTSGTYIQNTVFTYTSGQAYYFVLVTGNIDGSFAWSSSASTTFATAVGTPLLYPPAAMMASTLVLSTAPTTYLGSAAAYPSTSVGTYTASASQFAATWDPWHVFSKQASTVSSTINTAWAEVNIPSYSSTTPFAAVAGTAASTALSAGGTINGEWLQLQLPNALTMSTTTPSYKVWSEANSAAWALITMIFSWKLCGSNDGTNFTVLDTQTAQTWSAYNTAISYTLASAPSTSYKYYRIIATNCPAGYVFMGGMELSLY